MTAKGRQRQNAIKKAKRIRALALGFCALLFVIVIAGILIHESRSNEGGRVFESGGSHVTLREDGTFVASLPHQVRRTGTFIETDNTYLAKVEFIYNGRTAIGNITGNVLTLPSTWESGCAHRHSLSYTLR
ncbi:MAG: hypothetical protein FWE42_00475 [Defluviitaleaceae bacterium]|nr:hypothetical protein [Defluviitaleaceae bacterium]